MKMYKKIVVTVFAFLLGSVNLFAQNYKFGSVSKKEMEQTIYAKDSSANAVVLFKKRNDYYKYDNTTGWSIVSEVHERIKLFNKEGFEFASKKIPVYVGREDEKFTIKAYTYNLEKGKIVKTKLDRDEIYEEQISEYWSSRNFTMPNLKEGTIVEWKYNINSPYTTSINDIICQYNIPIEQLKCKVQIPEFFVFNNFPSRYYPINMKSSRVQKNYTLTSKDRSESSMTRGITTGSSYNNIKVLENTYTVDQKDIPALVEEPYVNNIDNYRAIVSFEISAYQPANGVPEFFNTSWEDVTKSIYENSNFGRQLDRTNFFEEDLNAVLEGINGHKEKTLAIFEFVKSKIKWNEQKGKYTHDGGIKKAYKDGFGNVAEVNLCLIAMLRASGIDANPILVSTRDHGIPIFPTKKGFNYVIAGVELNGDITLLDATEKYSFPNILPLRDLNWEGRLVREDGSSIAVNLYPKSYNLKMTKLNAKLDHEGLLDGVMITTYNGLNALNYRNQFSSRKEDDIISRIESANEDIEIEQFKLRNKENTNKPIHEMIKFTKENGVDIIGDKIYISPLLFLTVRENPFKLDERLYPIDYGSPWKNQTNISLEIPEGYTVESKPNDILLNLPNEMGTYALKTTLQENKILVTSQTKLNVPLIAPNYYETVKELYKRAIENQLEKIVLIQQGP